MTTHRRRTVLAAVGGLASATAGCLGVLHTNSMRDDPVSILAAGSLHYALDQGLRESVDVPIRIESHGSATNARLVAEGQREPDVLSLADTALFDAPLSMPRHTAFASNALVLAYDAETPAGRQIERATRWFEPLHRSEISIGRTDPDLDPLGYRTLFLFDLAERHYGRPRLGDEILGPRQTYPETELLAQLGTGSVDTAFVYRNMAIQHDYDFREFPPAIDLSDPQRRDAYGEASYTLPDGTTVRGDVITYGATALSDRPAVRDVFDEHVSGSYLSTYGFTVPDAYPVHRGNVPNQDATGA
jgi:molybdate/tungstate transport system substrate-binding protein